MRFATLAAVSFSAAAVGEAFLIPPAVKGDFRTDEINLITPKDPNSQVVKTSCKGCMDDGSDGALIYDFVASNLGQPRFLINGVEYRPGTIMDGVKLPLVKADDSLSSLAFEDLKSKEVDALFTVIILQEELVDGKVYRMEIKPSMVNGMPIFGPETETVEVILASDNDYTHLALLDAKIIQSSEELVPPIFVDIEDVSESAEGLIKFFLDKLRAWGEKTEDKVTSWGKKIGQKFRPCGKPAIDVTGTDDNTSDPQIVSPFVIPDKIAENTEWHHPPHSHPHHRPHHPHESMPYHHPHHPHHHEFTRHNVPSTIYKIFRQVLLPIVIGVGAGMLVSLMGMIVGHIAVMAYHKAVGVKLAKNPEADEEVAKGLLSEEEYRDAPPVYEEGSTVAVDEKQ